MPTSVPASTSGTLIATTRPVRQPSDRKLTISTMASASRKLSWNSATSLATTCDWSFSRTASIPSGRVGAIACIRSATRRPRSRILPPCAMETASARAGLPLTRIVAAGGSTVPRLTVAISPSFSRRPPAETGIARSASTPSTPAPVRT